jgi:hypothetical protein
MNKSQSYVEEARWGSVDNLDDLQDEEQQKIQGRMMKAYYETVKRQAEKDPEIPTSGSTDS